jgi:hypothetical protein
LHLGSIGKLFRGGILAKMIRLMCSTDQDCSVRALAHVLSRARKYIQAITRADTQGLCHFYRMPHRTYPNAVHHGKFGVRFK